LAEWAPVHEICAREPGELDWPAHSFLSGLGHSQDEKGDQGDGNLNAHGVLRDADEVPDFQGLLDPAKEQFDLPALLVEVRDLFSRCVQVVSRTSRIQVRFLDFSARKCLISLP
jgi:hypothetical protein